MSIFDKFGPLSDLYDSILEVGDDPFSVCMAEILSPTRALIDGREVLLAGTNNYLGLTFDPECVRAGQEAMAKQGTGTTGSRFANGTYTNHKALEQALAKFLGYQYTIVFSTGYQANLGVISGLTGQGDTILIDADCHASIYDGCKLSDAETIRFRHNSPKDLDKRLTRLGQDGGNALVIVEGMYSMFGDVAPVAEIEKVAHEHGAYLFVDEAHSYGVFGDKGRGVSEDQGVLDKIDFYVGTFSKSLGSVGGFAASNHPEFELLRCVSRPYMFTASMSPANVASVLEAVHQIEKRPELRQALWRNSSLLYDRLHQLGFELCADKGPIIAVKMPSREDAVMSWNWLMQEGVYVNLAIPPGTPNATSLLRLSISAAHSVEEIEEIGEIFSRLAEMRRDTTPISSDASAKSPLPV